MLWCLLTLVSFYLFQGIFAQSDVSCLPFYNWTFNSEKKSPCDVASSLLAVCNNGPYPVEPLPDSSHYLGPSLQNANACQCNTVTYSLMSACGACQGQTYLSWSVWSANCPMVYVNSYPKPIPSGIHVPGWAYLDVEANDNFDQTNARNSANLTESTALPSPTSSAVKTQGSTVSTVAKSQPSTSGTMTTPTISSSSSATDSTSLLATTHENAIGGGVVGGVVGVALLFGTLYWLIHRRKRMGQNAERLPSPPISESKPWDAQSSYMRQVVETAPHASVLPSSTSSIAGPTAYNFDSSVSGSADSMPMVHAQRTGHANV